ncbi:MAG: DMT family transporter [Wenzhouxiangellaceae bacterium]
MTDQAGEHRSAVVALLIATLSFAVMDMALKLLADHYPTPQVVMIRALASLPLILLVTTFFGGFRQLRTRRWRMHLLRGLLGIVMLNLVVFSFQRLTLAQAYTMFFTGPLFITLLSIPLLKEKVGRHRWTAVAIGFCGVLVSVNPQGPGLISIGSAAALLAASMYAIIALTMRALGSTESSLNISFYFMLALGFGSGLMAIPTWQPLDLAHVHLYLMTGISGTAGMVALATAFRKAQASAIAPFEYSAMLWVVLLDWLVWGTLPGLRLYMGAAIIIAAGIYILRREASVARNSALPVLGDEENIDS